MKIKATQTYRKTWEADDKRKGGFQFPRYRLSIGIDDGELNIYGRVYKPTDQALFFEALDKLVEEVKTQLLMAEKE